MDAYWNEERLKIKAWLADVAPVLSGMYEIVIGLVYGPSQSISTGQMAAHGMREVMNSLPGYIAGEAMMVKRVDYPRHCKEITPLWMHAGLPVGTAPAPVPLTEDSIKIPSVPPDLIFRIGYLIHDHEAGTNRKRLNQAALFTALNQDYSTSIDLLQPIMNEWEELAEWFVSKCHVKRKNFAPVQIEELKEKIQQLESMLSVMSDNFFNIMEDLDEVIQQANS